MKKILWIVTPVALIALLFAAHSAFSYGGGMHHGRGGDMFGDMMVFHLQHMAKDLNLSPDQQSKLDAIEKGMHGSMDEGTSNRDQLHSTIQQQVSSGTFDFGQIRPLLDAHIDQRATAAHATIANLATFYSSLSADQKTKIATDMKQHMDEMQERKERWKQNKSGSDNQQPQQQN